MSSPNLEQIVADMRAAGKRVTDQRLAVLAILAESYPRHLDASEIYERTRQTVPKMNLASVYRTLKMMKELNLVDEMAVDDGGRRYGLKRASEQYHLVCSQCDQVIAVTSPLLDRLQQLRQELAQDLPFVVDNVEVHLIGHCEGKGLHCKWSDNGESR